MKGNYVEFETIPRDKLPKEWQKPIVLREFKEFLQSNWNEREIFYSDENLNSEQQFVKFTNDGLKLKNYIGFISFKGVQLNIFPKVFQTHKWETLDTKFLEQKLLENLAIWLEYSAKSNFCHLKIDSDFGEAKSLREIFVTLYLKLVEDAMQRSLFFRYEEQQEDLKLIKGKLDISDYYTKKIATSRFIEFNCNYSSFEFDNLLNQIIKYTCKHILKSDKLSDTNKRRMDRILFNLSEVSDVRCVANDCNKIMLSAMQEKYKAVLSLSKMFLMNKETMYASNSNEAFCFLFPAELLFESFIGGFVKSEFGDFKVTLQKEQDMINSIEFDGKFYAKTKKLKYDIYVEKGDKIVIFDTKYKKLNRFKDSDSVDNILKELSDTDLKQVVIYALKENIDKVFLLYPQSWQENLDDAPIVFHSEFPGGKGIKVVAWRIPFVFDELNNTKDSLIKVFKGILLSL